MTLPQEQVDGVILTDIVKERRRQDAKWGAARAHAPAVWSTILSEENGEVAEAALDIQFAPEMATTEAYLHLREELVQVAAVAMAAIEDLDRHDLQYAQLPITYAQQVVHEWYETSRPSPGVTTNIRKMAFLDLVDEDGRNWTVAKVNGTYTKIVLGGPAE